MEATVHLSSAAILDLNASPFQLVAAPAAGQVIVPLAIYARLNFAAAAYALVSSIRIGYTGISLANISQLTPLLEATQSANAFCQAILDFELPLTSFDARGLALMLDASTGNPTLGGGSLDVSVVYQLVTNP